MNSEEIRNKIVKIINCELHLGTNMELHPDTGLLEIGIDSIALMSLLVHMEEVFGFEAGEDALLGNIFNNLGDLVTYIESKLQS